MKNIEDLIQKEKEKKLIQYQMYDKIKGTPDNPGSYSDDDGQTTYNIQPWDVSDEDYQRFKLYASDGDKPNIASKLLFGIAVTAYICSAVVLLLLLIDENKSESYLSYIYLILATFISGSLFLGFSEVIKLLHSINSKII